MTQPSAPIKFVFPQQQEVSRPLTAAQTAAGGKPDAVLTRKKIKHISEHPSLHDQMMLALRDPHNFMKLVQRIPYLPDRVLKNSAYKTSFCASVYQMRSCEYGDQCDFAHSVYEKIHYCAVLDFFYKTKQCMHHVEENCPYKEKCFFVHEGDLMRIVKLELAGSLPKLLGFGILNVCGDSNRLPKMTLGLPMPIPKDISSASAPKNSVTEGKESSKETKEEEKATSGASPSPSPAILAPQPIRATTPLLLETAGKKG